MDYRDLLMRYMAFVEKAEGSNFVEWVKAGDNHGVPFTQAEVDELNALDAAQRRRF
jgi:hypothetical protein